jgi:hypothetical protein
VCLQDLRVCLVCVCVQRSGLCLERGTGFPAIIEQSLREHIVVVVQMDDRGGGLLLLQLLVRCVCAPVCVLVGVCLTAVCVCVSV